MARIETVERTLFSFDELDDSAKETARNWWRGCIESDELSGLNDWDAIAAILGIEFKTRPVQLMNGKTRYDNCVYWTGFSSQGDGASFEGWYNYAKGAPKAIRQHAPKDKELHRIADELQSVQRAHFYQLQATMGRGSLSNFYSHSGTMSVDVTDRRDEWRDVGSAEDTLTVLMRDFADWIYSQVWNNWEWLNADEQVDESIRINEYEFDESGNIA